MTNFELIFMAVAPICATLAVFIFGLVLTNRHERLAKERKDRRRISRLEREIDELRRAMRRRHVA